MEVEKILPEIIRKNDNKILMLVMDGLGGLPHPETGLTELETAKTPNLDELAKKSSCGLMTPVATGITPGSGPAHFGLFGYDPIEHQIGRGILECTGIGMELKKEDLAIRGNFATIDGERTVLDRRAGRIPTEENERLVRAISENITEIQGIKIIIKTVKEHRCAIVLSGKNLHSEINENDPQKEGLPLKELTALQKDAEFTANFLKELLKKVEEILKTQNSRADTLLLRGFSKLPGLPTFEEKYKLKAVCIATYPMYKGLAKLVGMDIAKTGEKIEDEFETLKEIYSNYDFFFLHIKKTDSYGEDGNFSSKVKIIEEVDAKLPIIKDLKFTVITVTADHSTPSVLKSHSWHPVPFILTSPYAIPDSVSKFTERECGKGILGRFHSTSAIYLMLACSLKLNKFGA